MVTAALEGHVETVTRGLAAILIVFPLQVLKTPGALALTSMGLALQGINAFDVVFSYPELVFFVTRSEAQRAFAILDAMTVPITLSA